MAVFGPKNQNFLIIQLNLTPLENAPILASYLHVLHHDLIMYLNSLLYDKKYEIISYS